MKRIFGVIVIVFMAAVVASAYTLVMRDGRRVEIPDTFVVDGATLTYKVAADIQVTVQLATVDIDATHRLNNDRRLTIVPSSSVPVRQPARTITNRDLETYRKARVDSEVAYEKRRKELGLPSLAEQQRQIAELTERSREQALKTQASEAQTENYWRQRASDLRAALNATDARIQSVQRLLDQLPVSYSFGAFTTVALGTFGGSNFPLQRAPRVFAPRSSVNVSVPLGRGNLVLNARRFDGPRHFNRFGPVLAIPFQQSDYGLDRLNLVNQLNELTVYRAGLQASWRDLEEEARRAGAAPGWLR